MGIARLESDEKISRSGTTIKFEESYYPSHHYRVSEDGKVIYEGDSKMVADKVKSILMNLGIDER